MKTAHPGTKVGLVLLGFVVAWALAWFAMVLRERATDGPDARAAAGMYAAGDFFLGVAVFGIVALVPIGLALYWLRPVDWFWSMLTASALCLGLTGLFAMAASVWLQQSRNSWLLLAHARVGLMPLIALTLVTCALFAPRPRDRWLLLGVAGLEGTIFASVLIKFALPHFGGG